LGRYFKTTTATLLASNGLSTSSKAALGVGISLIILSCAFVGGFIFFGDETFGNRHLARFSRSSSRNDPHAQAELEAKQVPGTKDSVAHVDLPELAGDSRVR
jgi:hypothetical protein